MSSLLECDDFNSFSQRERGTDVSHGETGALHARPVHQGIPALEPATRGLPLRTQLQLLHGRRHAARCRARIVCGGWPLGSVVWVASMAIVVQQVHASKVSDAPVRPQSARESFILAGHGTPTPPSENRAAGPEDLGRAPGRRLRFGLIAGTTPAPSLASLPGGSRWALVGGGWPLWVSRWSQAWTIVVQQVHASKVSAVPVRPQSAWESFIVDGTGTAAAGERAVRQDEAWTDRRRDGGERGRGDRGERRTGRVPRSDRPPQQRLRAGRARVT